MSIDVRSVEARCYTFIKHDGKHVFVLLCLARRSGLVALSSPSLYSIPSYPTHEHYMFMSYIFLASLQCQHYLPCLDFTVFHASSRRTAQKKQTVIRSIGLFLLLKLCYATQQLLCYSWYQHPATPAVPSAGNSYDSIEQQTETTTPRLHAMLALMQCR